MKLFLIIAVALIGMPPLISGSEIEGQIFIATKGGTAIKLPLIRVNLYDKDVVVNHIATKINQAAAIKANLEELADEWTNRKRVLEALYAKAKEPLDIPFNDPDRKQLVSDYYEKSDLLDKVRARLLSVLSASLCLKSGFYYLDGMPRPKASEKSDADGKFFFNDIKSGEYVLVARGKRLVGDEEELYFWFVAINAPGKILLSNDNLSTSNGYQSLVFTTTSEDLAAKTGVFHFDNIQEIAKTLKDKSDQWEKENGGKLAEMLRKDQEKLQAEQEREAKLQRIRQAAQKRIKEEREQARQAKLAIYREYPELAQRHAVERLPEIGRAGTPENEEFLKRTARYRAEKPDFFNEPDWPIRLAEEIKGE
ncbi:MAG TPA: hypothetical protein VNQ90_15685 [Chthoniobacteraceae bacterium]|nr:hypothetical protein [Chthoniobacteraceae bacterium]